MLGAGPSQGAEVTRQGLDSLGWRTGVPLLLLSPALPPSSSCSFSSLPSPSWPLQPALSRGAGASGMAQSQEIQRQVPPIPMWQAAAETEHPGHIHHACLPSEPRQDGNDFCQLCSSPLPLAAPSCLLKKREREKEKDVNVPPCCV